MLRLKITEFIQITLRVSSSNLFSTKMRQLTLLYTLHKIKPFFAISCLGWCLTLMLWINIKDVKRLYKLCIENISLHSSFLDKCYHHTILLYIGTLFLFIVNESNTMEWSVWSFERLGWSQGRIRGIFNVIQLFVDQPCV